MTFTDEVEVAWETIENVPEVDPATMAMLDGTVAAALLLLKVTVIPPAGAAVPIRTVPVPAFPAKNVVGTVKVMG